MVSETMVKVYLYTRFERFWHWVQALLIVLLIVTGLEIHGSFTLLGFGRAAEIHNYLGIGWLVLFVFNIFWLATTGEWKQYIPTTKKLLDVIRYYAYDIFRGKPHPVKKRKGSKHNPLQRLTYLGLSAVLLPAQMATGLLYYTYNQWPELGLAGMFGLGPVALVHTALAFLLLSFLIVHVYMTTTGHTLAAHVAAMCTGWEEVEPDVPIEDWETHQYKKEPHLSPYEN